MNTQTLTKQIRNRTAIVRGMVASIIVMLFLSLTVDASEGRLAKALHHSVSAQLSIA